jgi:2-dehydro-3-deoxyphosphogluconate aldolase/(4S)-4-hydroxy-2-oxoglutarate aldolase
VTGAAPRGPSAPEVVAAIAAARLLPVVVIEDAADALPLARALKAGGLRCVEVTLRTAAAVDALRALAGDRELTVGAGTVLSVRQLESVAAAGARYVVTPGFSTEIVRRAQELSLPVFPGVATATDLHAAASLGLEQVKFFPAEPLGGLDMLTALAGPFPSMRFIPTGGIGPANLAGYLRHPAVLAVGGSWMVAPALIRAGDFAEITRVTAQATALVSACAAPA